MVPRGGGGGKRLWRAAIVAKRPGRRAPGSATLVGMTDDEWTKLGNTIKRGVAEGVLLAGLVLILLNVACGMLLAGVKL